MLVLWEGLDAHVTRIYGQRVSNAIVSNPMTCLNLNFSPFSLILQRTSTHKAEAQVRAECLEVVGKQKSLLFQTFSGLLKDVRQVALIGFPNHGNKGDSAIWYAEEVLLANLGIKIVYQCDSFWDFDMDALKLVATKLPYFAIMFHGGGNFGDIYLDYPTLRLEILKELPAIPTIYFPQSISYSNPDNAKELAEALRQHSSVTIHVRDTDSLSFATAHFNLPNVKISLVPDIVFYLGSLHDLRFSFGTSQQDLLFFKRTDSESTKQWTEDMGGFVKRLGEGSTPPHDPSWSQGDWVDFDTESSILDTSFSNLAWQRFMLGSSWLSKYEFIVLDRLHGKSSKFCRPARATVAEKILPRLQGTFSAYSWEYLI